MVRGSAALVVEQPAVSTSGSRVTRPWERPFGAIRRGNMYLRTAIVLVMLAGVGRAAEISIDQGALRAETQATLRVNLASRGDTPTGLQFDLEYDAALLNVTVDAGPAAERAGKSLQSSLIQPGKLRALIVGFNQNVIPDGAVAIVHVSRKSPVEAGKIFPIHMTALAATNQRAETLVLSGQDGGVTAEARRNDQ